MCGTGGEHHTLRCSADAWRDVRDVVYEVVKRVSL